MQCVLTETTFERKVLAFGSERIDDLCLRIIERMF